MNIKKELDKRGIVINMHVLDNEAPELCKDAIEKSKCTYQLVPPNNHLRNSAEWAIRTLKNTFFEF